MGKKSAEDYLDKLLNSVNDEKMKKEKFKETAKMLEDAVHFLEEDGDDLNFEEASYMAMTEKEEKKSEQEEFLDSLLNGAKNTKFGMNKRTVGSNPMYSRRVSKSEADFLREFEAELANGDDDFADLFDQFDEVIEPEDKLGEEDIFIDQPDCEADIFIGEQNREEAISIEEPKREENISVEEPENEDFILGEVDLAALMEAASSNPDATSGESILDNEAQSVGVDVFEAFGGFATEEIPVDTFETGEIPEVAPLETTSEGIDLGNLGEEDLMNLLAGADDLSDIGAMLSQNESDAEFPIDGLDAFAAFAEGEMTTPDISAEQIEDEIELDKKGKKGKAKGGLLGKLSAIISGLMADDEDDEVKLNTPLTPTPEVLSGENQDILAELEQLEEKPGKKKKDKKKKDKKEKKPKKEKKEKEPKPKKEKKPKEVDNTPPLPKGPVIMIWVMVGSLFALVMLGVNMIGYNFSVSNAKNLKNQAHYAEAFVELDGLEIKEKDMELYNQLAILATADSELNAYEVFEEKEMVVEAFDSLVCAVGRCELNEESAELYGCLGQLDILKKTAVNELESKYNTTYEEAIEIYSYSKHDRDAYSVAIYEKLLSLGYELN